MKLDLTLDLTEEKNRFNLLNYWKSFTPSYSYYKGFTLWILKSGIDNINGYIELKPNFLEWLIKEGHINNLEVHGGITFDGTLKIDTLGREITCIGFDTAHIGDLTPIDIDEKYTSLYPSKVDYEYLNTKKIWTEIEVGNELRSLVKQLAPLKEQYEGSRYITQDNDTMEI